MSSGQPGVVGGGAGSSGGRSSSAASGFSLFGGGRLMLWDSEKWGDFLTCFFITALILLLLTAMTVLIRTHILEQRRHPCERVAYLEASNDRPRGHFCLSVCQAKNPRLMVCISTLYWGEGERECECRCQCLETDNKCTKEACLTPKMKVL